MSNDEQYSLAEAHRRFAVDCFNSVWGYLDDPSRTAADDQAMIAAAYTSLYHWSQVGTTVNLVRGHWQVSRVLAVLERYEIALEHASTCLRLCQEAGIGNFDLAYAYEAMARASQATPAERDRYLGLAREAAAHIAEEEDRKLLLGDLATIG